MRKFFKDLKSRSPEKQKSTYRESAQRRSRTTDAFINYQHKDRHLASQIAAFLQHKGLSVFWDRDIPPGLDFLEMIERNLREAQCVITLWTENSINSNWVKAEADFALKTNKLLPILVGDDLKIPLGYGLIQTDIISPRQLTSDAWLDRLHNNLQHFLTTGPSKKPEEPATQKVPQDKSLQNKKAFISHAEQDAQTATALVKYLEASRCPCWISFRDVDPGEDYRQAIIDAMNAVIFLVLVYSRHVNSSFDVATELLLARKRRKKRLFLRTDDSEPGGPIEYEVATVQWIDAQSDMKGAFQRIAERAEML